MRHLLSGRSTRARSRFVVTSVVAAAALGLAACGGGSDGGTTTTGSSEVDGALADEVAQLQEPLDSFPVPTDPLEGVEKLKGKTVYYIPLTQQAPSFTVTATALNTALSSVGMKAQVCDGGANPTSISACVNQAVGASAAGIITDAIPYAMASNAIDAAQKSGVPVLIADQIPSDDAPAGDTLNYQEGAGTEMLSAVAKWIVVDSGGTGKVVLNAATDNPSSRAYGEAAEKIFSDDCPDCSVTINEVSSANFSLIASSTSSALLKTPNVGYLISQFDNYLQPTMGGAQQSGKNTLKGASSAATLTTLKMVNDQNFLYAEAAQALPYQGWTLADAIMRMALGEKVLDLEVPYRLFTRDNIDSIDLTEQAEASGEWFGPTGFEDDFKALWGVA